MMEEELGVYNKFIVKFSDPILREKFSLPLESNLSEAFKTHEITGMTIEISQTKLFQTFDEAKTFTLKCKDARFIKKEEMWEVTCKGEVTIELPVEKEEEEEEF